jgi:hypothetical protein
VRRVTGSPSGLVVERDVSRKAISCRLTGRGTDCERHEDARRRSGRRGNSRGGGGDGRTTAWRDAPETAKKAAMQRVLWHFEALWSDGLVPEEMPGEALGVRSDRSPMRQRWRFVAVLRGRERVSYLAGCFGRTAGR